MRFTFLLVGLILVAGALAAVLLPDAWSGGFESRRDAFLFAGAASTFLLGAALLAWRDVHAFATLAALIGAFGAACVALALGVGGPVTAPLVAFAAAATTSLAAGSAFLVFTQLRKGAVPDVLVERFGRHAVYEIDGIQLAANCPASAPANVVAALDVYLQNCLDGPRTVEIELDDQPLFGRGGAIRWRRPARLELGPSEVKLVQIPVCLAHAGPAEVPVYLCVRARGPRARRSRHRRAPYAAHPLRRWQIAMIVLLALPLVTIIVWGRGGLKLPFRFSSGVPRSGGDELPEPQQHVIWPGDGL